MDAKAQVGVFESAVITRQGSRLESVSNDIGSTEGRQVFHFSTGASAEVLGFHGRKRVFLQGNELGLVNYFGFPKSEGALLAGRWLELTPGNPNYTPVIAATWLASDFSQPMLSSPMRFSGYQTISGHRVRGITGVVTGGPKPHGLATIYVTTSGKVLPVRFYSKSGGYVVATTWTGWGHDVSFGIPGNALQLSPGGR